MPSCLWDPNFIAMIVYGCLAIPVSLLNISTIVCKRDQFKGSFYKIYVVISIHEMIMYFVKYPVIRLPLFTGANCPLVPFFENGHFFGLDLIHFVHWHVGFTVLMLETTIALDRWIIILLESKWKRIWQNYYVFMIMLAIVFPTVISHVVLRTESTYQYFPDTDNYQIITVVDVCCLSILMILSFQFRDYLYNGAIVMLLSCTGLSLVMNSTVLYAFCSGRFQIVTNQKRAEWMLFIYSFIELISELLMIIVFVVQRFTPIDSSLYNFSRYFLLFTQDAVTLIPSFVLLATSAQLRHAVMDIFRRQSKTSPFEVPVTNYSFSTRLK